jgi:hypothetical protein
MPQQLVPSEDTQTVVVRGRPLAARDGRGTRLLLQHARVRADALGALRALGRVAAQDCRSALARRGVGGALELRALLLGERHDDRRRRAGADRKFGSWQAREVRA